MIADGIRHPAASLLPWLNGRWYAERMVSIGLEFMAAGCPNACRHCKDEGHPPFGDLLSLEDLEWSVEEFRKVATHDTVSNLWHEPTAHSDLIALLTFWQENSDEPKGTWEYLATNGFGIARAGAPEDPLHELKKLGIHALSFNLHGLEQQHDWFACRKGAYQDIWTAAGYGASHRTDQADTEFRFGGDETGPSYTLTVEKDVTIKQNVTARQLPGFGVRTVREPGRVRQVIRNRLGR